MPESSAKLPFQAGAEVLVCGTLQAVGNDGKSAMVTFADPFFERPTSALVRIDDVSAVQLDDVPLLTEEQIEVNSRAFASGCSDELLADARTGWEEGARFVLDLIERRNKQANSEPHVFGSCPGGDCTGPHIAAADALKAKDDDGF